MVKPKPSKKFECQQCSDVYESTLERSRYCNKTVVSECLICKSEFIQKFRGRVIRTCGKSCGSKLIRKEQGENNIRACIVCGDNFNALVLSALYCNKTIKSSCKSCGYFLPLTQVSKKYVTGLTTKDVLLVMRIFSLMA